MSQELLQTTLNLIFSFFYMEFYRKKVHGFHHALSNIFHESVMILIFHSWIWNLSLV